MAWLGVNREMGGNTPKASAVSMMILLGCPARPVSEAFGIKDSGSTTGIFGQRVVEKVQFAGFRSITTFSSTVPKRCVVA